MSTMPMPFDQWSIEYHETMAAVAVVGTAVKRGVGTLGLVKSFSCVERKFRHLLNHLSKIRKFPPESLPNLTDRLLSLKQSVDEVLAMSAQKGLTNRSF